MIYKPKMSNTPRPFYPPPPGNPSRNLLRSENIKSLKTKDGLIILIRDITKFSLGDKKQEFIDVLKDEKCVKVYTGDEAHEISILENIDFYEFRGFYLSEDTDEMKIKIFLRKLIAIWESRYDEK